MNISKRQQLNWLSNDVLILYFLDEISRIHILHKSWHEERQSVKCVIWWRIFRETLDSFVSEKKIRFLLFNSLDLSTRNLLIIIK